MSALTVNARFRRGPQTGVQRVAAEITARLSLPLREVAPRGPATGLRGHAWEQLVFPATQGGGALWSPCNTGPLSVRNQVVTIHDAAVFDHPEWFSRAFVATYRFLLPRLARRVRRIVTVSDFSRRRLAVALNLPESAIEVVPNGVSPAFVPQPAEAIAAVCARYGVEPERYFVTLSTLEPRKNLSLVLDAWRLAQPLLPAETRLLLLGGGGASHIFASGGEGGDAPGVLRSGFVPDADLPALLGGAIALVYPSRYEGFGLPLLEAMACGTAVVGARTSSLSEVGGDAARYVDPDDAPGLAALMQALSEDRSWRGDLALAGLERARGFSWSDSAAAMDALLRHELRF